MRNFLIGLFLVFAMASVASADIFKSIPNDEKNQIKAEAPKLDAGTILSDAAAIINYLGVREGYAYNFHTKEWVATTGATIISYTPWNLAVGVAMLKTDGVVVTLDWNIGKYLPVENVPVMRYFSYLYVDGGIGAELNWEDKWKQAPVLGAEFKLTF